MKKLTLVAALAATFGVAGAAYADDAAPAAAAPAAAPAAPADPFSYSGYLVGSYTNFSPSYSGNSSSTVAQRQFEQVKNTGSLALNQAALTLNYLPAAGLGASATLIGGSDAQILRLVELAPGKTNSSEFDVATAYAQYVSGPVSLYAGKLATLAGEEVVSPVADNEVSRSLLFYDFEPISHTGLRGTYAVSDTLSLTAGVNNGFNYVSKPSGNSQTIELGVSGTPSKALSYSAAYYYTGTSSYYGGNFLGQAQLLDLVVNYTVSDALNVGANADFASKDHYSSATAGTASAAGLALYANYSLNDKVTLSGRAEYVSDSKALFSTANGHSNDLSELTLAVNYTPIKALKLTAEARADSAQQAIFGPSTSPNKTSQTSFELQAAYSF